MIPNLPQLGQSLEGTPGQLETLHGLREITAALRALAETAAKVVEEQDDGTYKLLLTLGDLLNEATAGGDLAGSYPSPTLAATINTDVTWGGTHIFSKGLVVNESGDDLDTRIEGDNDANLIFVDAGNDRVGVGMATPAHKLDINGTLRAVGAVTFDSTLSVGDNLTVDKSGFGVFNLRGDNKTATELAAVVGLAAHDDGNSDTTYAQLVGYIADPAAGAEDGEWRLRATVAGSLEDILAGDENGIDVKRGGIEINTAAVISSTRKILASGGLFSAAVSMEQGLSVLGAAIDSATGYKVATVEVIDSSRNIDAAQVSMADPPYLSGWRLRSFFSGSFTTPTMASAATLSSHIQLSGKDMANLQYLKFTPNVTCATFSFFIFEDSLQAVTAYSIEDITSSASTPTEEVDGHPSLMHMEARDGKLYYKVVNSQSVSMALTVKYRGMAETIGE